MQENSIATQRRKPLRVRRPPVDKFEARRNELAQAALATLGEMGYAKTSLREIAQKAEFTHGVLHYYFTDKLDLINCSIRYYKASCVTRYDQITHSATTNEELIKGFLDKLAETIRDEAPMHCLWYDLRTQALFEPAFRQDVSEIDKSLEDMVWRVLSRYAELAQRPLNVNSSVAYALLDGIFQKYLLKYVSGDRDAIAALIEEVRGLLKLIA